MHRRRLLALPICILLTVACSLVTLPLPLGHRASPIAAATQALPPAPTAASTVPASMQPPAPTPDVNLSDDSQQVAAMLPAFAGDIARVHVATRYAIDVRVTFDPDAQTAHLQGTERLLFKNPLQVGLPDLVLMLWPNDEQYLSKMTAGPAVIDGTPVAGDLILGGIAMRFRLPATLPAGGLLDVTLPFSIDARGPIGGADPKRFGITEGVLLAPTFYPLVPRLTPDGRWLAEQAPPGGDTTNSDSAFYRVRITAGAAWQIAATGVGVSQRVNDDGTQTVSFVTGPVRDFAFALGPFLSKSRTVDGVSVRAWVLPNHQSNLGDMLTAAAGQLQEMDHLVGQYPFAELDVVDAPGAFGGIEYPGLVFIGTVGTQDLVIPTVHEVAHQWFYSLIGDDQIHQPWMDEAAASFAEILYYESIGQSTEATGLLSQDRQWLRLNPNATKPIGLGVGEYASEDEYFLIVYLKGALFFDALRDRLGTRPFEGFLQSYFRDYEYGDATSADFQKEAERACACDLQSLFDLWVYKGGTIPTLQ